MKVERWEVLGLAGVMAVAVAARLIGLNASLWYDEVFTLTHFVRLPVAQLVSDFSSLNNHMFYSLQAKASTALFGESAWALRLPAALFGLASLLAIWAMGREAVGRGAALLGTFLLAISYHHVWFSQNARGYTGLLFWTTVATLLFSRGLKRPSLGVWVGYALAVAAAMYTHLSAGFFFAAHAVVYLCGVALNRAGKARDAYPGFWDLRPIYGFALAGVFTALLHAPVFSQVLHTTTKVASGTAESSMAEWGNPLRTAREVLVSLGDLGPLAAPGLLVGLVLIGWGAVVFARRNPVVAAVYLLSIPLATAILLALSFRIWPRYFFVDIGFVFLCLSAGALALAAWAAERLRAFRAPAVVGRALVPLGVAAMAAASLFLLTSNYAHPKQDFAGAVALVEKERGRDDVTTSVGLAAEPIHGYFAPAWPVVENAGQLEAMLGSGRPVWLVTAFGDHASRAQPEVMAVVAARFEQVASLPGTLGGGTVRVYRSLGPTGAAPVLQAPQANRSSVGDIS